MRTVEEHAARRVNADLAVQLVVRKRQLHRLPDLLLLDVQAPDVLRAPRAQASDPVTNAL